jgi:serine/threonine protein phosphatase PrpC
MFISIDIKNNKKYCCIFFFSPDLASVTSFNVEENDFIVIGTDGLWDNLPDVTILEEIKKIKVSLFKHGLLFRERSIVLLDVYVVMKFRQVINDLVDNHYH